YSGAGRSFRRAVEDRLQGERAGAAAFGVGRVAALLGEALLLRLLPMAAGEEAGGPEARPVDAVETAGVDGDAIGLRARDVERVHAAMRAERVLRHAGAEGVGGQRGLALQQREIGEVGDQVENPLLGADRAVALRQAVEIDARAKAHPAAMAAAFTGFQHGIAP